MPSPRQRAVRPNTIPSIPAEEALSFLKDTKEPLSWTARDLADSVKITSREAEQVLAFLQAQGYAQPARQKESGRGTGQWLTTPAAKTVSAPNPPPYTRQ